MGLLGLFKRPKRVEEPEVEDTGPLPPLRPILNVLAPDVAGVTAFRLRQFEDLGEAADYLQSLPAVTSVHAFWGLNAEPVRFPGAEEGAGEAMVIIRADDCSDTVYVVSFVDIESAQSFARFEARRGMNMALLMIYWAEPVTVRKTEDGIELTPDEPPAITPVAMTPIPVSPGLERARLRQEEEKSRLQAEIEEIRERQAHTDELHRRQAQVDDKRKQLELVEKRRRQTKREEQRRLQAEATEIEKLRAEAEELRRRQAEAEEHERREAQARRLRAEEERMARLQAQAEEEERLRAELEEFERRQAEAEARERHEAAERAQRAEAERKKRQAEAEEMSALQAEAEGLAHKLAGELYLLAQEEKGRLNAERQDKPRLQAEAELTRRLQAELKEIKRKQVEAEARWHQDAEERRLRVEAEETKRRDEEEEKRRLEAEEAKRIQDELAEIRRQQAEATKDLPRTEEDEHRLQAEAERAGRLEAGLQQMRRQQIEAQGRWRQEAEERRLRAEAEERERRDAEDNKRRQEAEETRMIQAQLESIRRRLSETSAMQSDLNIDSPPEETAPDSPPPGPEGDDTTAWAQPAPPLEAEPEAGAQALEAPPEAAKPELTSESEPDLPYRLEFDEEEDSAGASDRDDDGKTPPAPTWDGEHPEQPVEIDLPEESEAHRAVASTRFETKAPAQPAAEEELLAIASSASEEGEPFALDEPETVATQEPALVTPPLDETVPETDEMDIEREALAFLKAAANRNKAPQTDGWTPSDAAPTEAGEPVSEEPAAAASETAAEELTELEGAVRTRTAAPVDQESADGEEAQEDLVQEVEKILQVKRWDKRESPFRGFDSPPGRF